MMEIRTPSLTRSKTLGSHIVKPNEFGETFGFGSWGDIFGAEVIAEFIVDE